MLWINCDVPVAPTNIHLQTLRAALGWLELGLPRDALDELAQLPTDAEDNADVLEVRWMIHADMKDWSAAMLASSKLIMIAAERASSWLHHAYAVRRASDGGLLRAFNLMAPVASRFPEEPTIPYNLACYTCQLQRGGTETMAWFERALAIGNPTELIQMALNDPDLAPVRDLIKKISAPKKRHAS